VKHRTVSKLLTHRLRRRTPKTSELASQLAPLEELKPAGPGGRINGSAGVAQEHGAIVVGTEQTAVPREVIESEERNGLFGIEPVVIIIVGLLLVFIAFIAWQVSRMVLPQ